MKGQHAVQQILALRKMPSTPSTQRAEAKVLERLTLLDVADVALALDVMSSTKKVGQ